MIYPNFIQKGSKIGVPAPSDGAYDEVTKNKELKRKMLLLLQDDMNWFYVKNMV